MAINCRYLIYFVLSGDLSWNHIHPPLKKFQALRITPNFSTTLGELDRFCDQTELIARKGITGVVPLSSVAVALRAT
jgi:hypothetical protein